MTIELQISSDSRSSTVNAVAGIAGCDGILNIHKPDGWTSHDVVKRVRSILRIQKSDMPGPLIPMPPASYRFWLAKELELHSI